jgi:hypothetical protein
VSVGGNTVPIQSVKAGNGAVTITWNSSAGRVYRAAYKNSLADSNWQFLSDTITATGPLTTYVDLISTNQQRFYLIAIVN